MTVSAQSLNPVSWWQGLGRLTRSGSSVEGLSWALYDFANTIFSFAIVSFAMGPWTTAALGERTGTLAFTAAASLSVALNAAVSPVLGAMSDRTGGRKRYLAVFTIGCIVPTLVIGVVNIWLGLLFFAIANFAYQAALIYYDALLPDVALPAARGRLSGVGVALGYVGSIVSALLLGTTTDADGNITAASFLLIGSLFAVFAIPIFVIVTGAPAPERRVQFRRGAALVVAAADHHRPCPPTAGTAALRDRSLLLHRPDQHRHRGHEPVRHQRRRLQPERGPPRADRADRGGHHCQLLLGDRLRPIGPKRTLMLVLGSWTVGLLLIGLWLDKVAFLVAGAILGSGLGGIAVTDRLLLLRLTKPEEVGEMLGLYGMAGKLSAVVGPLMFGAIVFALDPEQNGPIAYQVAILSLLVLMVIGFWIVRPVPEGTPPPPDELPLAAQFEPAIVPPGEVPL